MTDVVFVAPFALEATLRFVRAVASTPGVRLGMISQVPARQLPHDLRSRLEAHRPVGDCLDSDQLTGALREIATEWSGTVDRLIGILEQLQVPLAQVRERLGIRGMGVEEAHAFRDKALMKDILRRNDLPCARHALATSPAAALEFASENGYPLVVKPPAGAGAKNTFRVDREEDLAGWLRTEPPSRERPVLLEEFITGIEHSFDSVTLGRRHLFHSISRYLPTPLQVMETPWIQWSVILPRRIDGPEYDDIRGAGKRALDCLGMVTGLTHMEWFRREDGSIAISEVAARPPGAQFMTLLSYAHELDFYRAWARLLIHEEFAAPERLYAVGAVFLRGQGAHDSQRVRQVHGIDQARRELEGLVVEAKLPKPGQERSQGYEGEGYVILRHPETEAVEAGIRRVLELIRVELG